MSQVLNQKKQIYNVREYLKYKYAIRKINMIQRRRNAPNWLKQFNITYDDQNFSKDFIIRAKISEKRKSKKNKNKKIQSFDEYQKSLTSSESKAEYKTNKNIILEQIKKKASQNSELSFSLTATKFNKFDKTNKIFSNQKEDFQSKIRQKTTSFSNQQQYGQSIHQIQDLNEQKKVDETYSQNGGFSTPIKTFSAISQNIQINAKDKDKIHQPQKLIQFKPIEEEKNLSFSCRQLKQSNQYPQNQSLSISAINTHIELYSQTYSQFLGCSFDEKYQSQIFNQAEKELSLLSKCDLIQVSIQNSSFLDDTQSYNKEKYTQSQQKKYTNPRDNYLSQRKIDIFDQIKKKNKSTHQKENDILFQN